MFYASAGTGTFMFDLRRDDAVVVREATHAFDGAAKHGDEVACVAVDGKGDFFAACDDEGLIKVVDTRARKVFKTLRGGHSSLCTSVCFAPRAPWQLVSGGMDCNVCVWDYAKPAILQKLSTQDVSASATQVMNPPFVYSLGVSRDGRAVAAGLGNCQVVLYALEKPARGGAGGARSRKALLRERMRLRGHDGAVIRTHFPVFSWGATSSADNSGVDESIENETYRSLVSVGNDRRINLWDLSDVDIAVGGGGEQSDTDDAGEDDDDAGDDGAGGDDVADNDDKAAVDGDAEAAPTAAELSHFTDAYYQKQRVCWSRVHPHKCNDVASMSMPMLVVADTSSVITCYTVAK
jgi:WD40 repeat protein